MSDCAIAPSFNSYSDLLSYFYKFLSGDFEESCCDFFEDETLAIREQLLQINKAGILSFSSQPGVAEKDYIQRAYLSCYMHRDLADRIKSRLQDSEILAMVGELNKLTNNLDSSNEVELSKELDEEGNYVTTNSIMPTWKFEDLEIMLENTSKTNRKAISKNLVQVHFVDNQWGRETEMFDKLVAILN
jgi:hypothetical protein